MVALYGDHSVSATPDYPTYPFHPEARQTIIVRFTVEDGLIQRVSFVPCYINPSGQPEPLSPSDQRFTELVAYMQSITERAGFGTTYEVNENDVEVITG